MCVCVVLSFYSSSLLYCIYSKGPLCASLYFFHTVSEGCLSLLSVLPLLFFFLFYFSSWRGDAWDLHFESHLLLIYFMLNMFLPTKSLLYFFVWIIDFPQILPELCFQFPTSLFCGFCRFSFFFLWPSFKLIPSPSVLCKKLACTRTLSSDSSKIWCSFLYVQLMGNE